jgi:HEAT repeat protein
MTSAMKSIDEHSFQDLDSADWAVREQAFGDLFGRGPAAVPTLVIGAADRRPRVRAACIALMDHLADERCCASLESGLRDDSALVRRHAVHAVGCQRCKPQPLAIDVVGALIERASSDSSPRVRRVAVHQLGLQPHDPRAIETLLRVIAESRDAGLVSRARHALREQRARVV